MGAKHSSSRTRHRGSSSEAVPGMLETGRVLVIGATGTVGQQVVRSLRQKAIQLRLLCRNETKGRQLFGTDAGIEYSFGDVEAVSSWDKKLRSHLFRGVDRCFMVLPASPQLWEIEGELARLAAAAGVRHIVKLSVIGAGMDTASDSIMRWHGMAERAVLECGLPVTILRPNHFLQNFRNDADSIRTGGAFYRPAEGSRVAHVDVRDIADCAAVILSEPVDRHGGMTYDLCGPQAVTFEELAGVMSEALGRDVSFVNVKEEAFYQTLVGLHLPLITIRAYLRLFRFFRTGAAALRSSDVKLLTGNDPRSALEFFREHRSLFLEAGVLGAGLPAATSPASLAAGQQMMAAQSQTMVAAESSVQPIAQPVAQPVVQHVSETRLETDVIRQPAAAASLQQRSMEIDLSQRERPGMLSSASSSGLMPRGGMMLRAEEGLPQPQFRTSLSTPDSGERLITSTVIMTQEPTIVLPAVVQPSAGLSKTEQLAGTDQQRLVA